MNWQTFWAAVEALGTVATAIIALWGIKAIGGQIKQYRLQASQHKAAGYDWLMNFLEADRFGHNVGHFMTA